MAFCTSCGAQNEDSSKFCVYCGAKLGGEEPVQPEQQPAQPDPEPVLNERPPEHIYQSPGPQPSAQPSAQPTYQQPSYQQPTQDVFQQGMFQGGQPVAPIATGGLLAWSIVTILLCLIPGIVALVKTLGINKAATAEEQQKKYNSAKTWCIIGTVLGILSAIGQILAKG